MQEFVDELLALRSHCGEKAESLLQKFGKPDGSAPIGALKIAFNNLTLSAELASYYLQRWSSTILSDPGEIERQRRENSERCIILGKNLFTAVLSGCEYHAKEANTQYPAVLNLMKKRLYLREILERSEKLGMIATNTLWAGAISVRNCLVHNNGVADENRVWEFSPQLKIVFEDGKMTQGTMMTMPRLTRWAIDAYVDWCDGFLSKADPQGTLAGVTHSASCASE